MTNKRVSAFATAVAGLTVLNGVAFVAQQDRHALKVPDGLALSSPLARARSHSLRG